MTTQPTHSPTPPASAPFALTDSAAARINALKAKKDNMALRFRITIKGGGCSGFQYLFDLDANPPTADDHVFSHDGAQVVIDSVSLSMVEGSTLDYTEDLAQAGFEIKNPQATANCGCGNSFSIPI